MFRSSMYHSLQLVWVPSNKTTMSDNVTFDESIKISVSLNLDHLPEAAAPCNFDSFISNDKC